MDNVYQKHQAAIIAASYGIVPTAQEAPAAAPVVENTTTAAPEIQKSETVEEIKDTAPAAETTVKDKVIEKSETVNDINKVEDAADLVKGDIADALLNDYGNANATFKFEKSGKELKEILPKTIATLSVIRDVILAQLGVFQASAGVTPTESYKSYRIPTVEVLLYPYELTRRVYNEMTSDYEAYTDAQVACNSYNDAAYRLRSVLEDIAACQVIIDNVEDNKKYSLSVSQLVAINIG